MYMRDDEKRMDMCRGLKIWPEPFYSLDTNEPISNEIYHSKVTKWQSIP